jgi:DNA-binding transcriptional ArsR family regulator
VFVVDEARVRRARADLLAPHLVEEIAETFSALAHPTRVRILQALAHGELCVCEISEVVELSISAASHQLRLLRGLRLVRARHAGKLVYYSLSNSFFVALLDDCARHLQRKDQPA